jgi:hypothetical protein
MCVDSCSNKSDCKAHKFPWAQQRLDCEATFDCGRKKKNTVGLSQVSPDAQLSAEKKETWKKVINYNNINVAADRRNDTERRRSLTTGAFTTQL